MINLYIFNETRRGAAYGVGAYIRELTAVLKDSNIKVCIVNIASDKPQIQTEETDGIRQWYIPKVIAQQRTIEDQKIDDLYYRNVVYLLQLHIEDKKNLVFHLNYNQCGSLAEELKNAFDCKLIAVSHFTEWGFKIYDNLPRLRTTLKEEDPDSLEESVKKSFEEDRSYYSKVDQVICLSEYMQDILCQDYGLDRANISIIPNGLPDIAPPVMDVEFLRNKWYISSGEKVILFAGRMDEVKGVSYLMKAFREVVQQYPEVRLILAGSGSYDTFLQEAKDICTKITFTGLLEKDELYELYQLADIGVVPSLFEPFGYVAVEMMIHELPLVATATSGLNEVVDSTCGLKVPLTGLPENVEIDPSLLAQKIMYLIQHPTEAKKLGQNGRKRYLKEYSSEIFRRNMLHLYTSL
ncbi:MAG: TIGR04157 family glycosyltransferase [Tannerellaceae bacterium]|nr:TIGR04157 family glycosyltransferase [Tannerellaceae bacterium]